MSKISPNLNNIFLKKQINPSFKADYPAQYQSGQTPEYGYQDVEQYQNYYPQPDYNNGNDYYYPDNYYVDNGQYNNYYPAEQYSDMAYDDYQLTHDKNGQPILPAIYDNADRKEPKGILETLKNEPTKMIGTWFTNPLLMLGTCAGLSYGVDAFNNACSGEYEKTLLGKATRFGDKIEQSKLAQSKPVQSTVKAIKKGWKKTWDFLNKSELIRSMTKTPSLPEWDTAKYDIIPQNVRILEDFNTIADNLELRTDNNILFKNVGVTRSEREMLKKFHGVKSISELSEESAVNTVLLKRLGKSDSEISSIVNSHSSTSATKAEIQKALGLNLTDLEKIKVEPEKCIDKVKEACSKVGGKVKVGRGYHNILGGFQPLASDISCDQVANKLKSLHVGDGAKTATGRAMSQLIQKIHRGFTFGGGKLSIFFFIAPWLVMAMKNTKKADPDQKVGTAAYGLIESISWVFTFPLAIKTIYALGGMKYAGMSTDDVTKYRDLIKNFNEAKFTDAKAHSDAQKALKKELKTLKNKNNNNLSLFSKLMKKIQSGLQLDLEMLKPFQDGNKFKDFLRRIPNNARNWVGVPLRIIITGFVIESAYRNLLMKGVKAIFGKNYDEMREEEHEEGKKAQKEFTIQDLRKRMLEVQEAKLGGVVPAEAEEFNIPEDLKKQLAYDMRREAMEEQLEEQKNPVQNNTQENNEEMLSQEVTEQENLTETLSETNNVENYSEDNLINKYIQDSENTTKNIEEQPLQMDEQTDFEPPVTTGFVEDNTTNSMTPELVAAATAGGAAAMIANQEAEKAKLDNYDYLPTQTPSDEILGQKKELKKDNYTYIPSQNPSKEILSQKKENKIDNYTYIPSEKNVIKEQEEKEEVRKYIPSQRAANISKSFDNSALDKAFARADRAEERALKILAGNFDGMV